MFTVVHGGVDFPKVPWPSVRLPSAGARRWCHCSALSLAICGDIARRVKGTHSLTRGLALDSSFLEKRAEIASAAKPIATVHASSASSTGIRGLQQISGPPNLNPKDSKGLD